MIQNYRRKRPEILQCGERGWTVQKRSEMTNWKEEDSRDKEESGWKGFYEDSTGGGSIAY